MSSRIAPSMLVAVSLLVLAAGGVGYAAGTVRSADIVDNTVHSRDIKDGTIGNADLEAESVARNKLDRGCRDIEQAAFGGCVRRVPYGPSKFAAALSHCNEIGGRLPTIAELKWLNVNAGITWADGNGDNYEFTGDSTVNQPLTPMSLDQAGNAIFDSTNQNFWHHCVTY